MKVLSAIAGLLLKSRLFWQESACFDVCCKFLFVLYEDEISQGFLIPCSGFGDGLFFGLGCFSVCTGMRGRFFLLICYVGVCWVGWDEDEEACWLVLFFCCLGYRRMYGL